MRRVVIPALFIALAVAMALAKFPICSHLYLSTLAYAAFLPAGRLAKWRISKYFPLAFPVYFLTLLAAGAASLIPPVGAEVEKVREAQGKFFHKAATCQLGETLVAVNVLVLAPLVEEIIFRGILFEVVRERAGAAAAYLISSALFAVVHGVGLGAVPIFIAALGLAFIYQKFGLPTAVLIHFFQNAVAFWIIQNPL